MKKTIITLIALLVAGLAFADTFHVENADTSPALRFENLGSEAVTINIYEGGAAATNTVVVGSTSNTIDGSGATDTVAELAAAIVACTNSAGNPVLLADTRCSVSTDSTDGELLDGTYTIAAKSGTKTYWGELLWDTSDVKWYSVYIPAARQAAEGVRSDISLDNIYGNPIGTGNVTLDVYVDGTKSWSLLMPEVYAYSNNTATVALPVTLDLPVQRKPVMIRATRATTATTGNIGVKVSTNP